MATVNSIRRKKAENILNGDAIKSWLVCHLRRIKIEKQINRKNQLLKVWNGFEGVHRMRSRISSEEFEIGSSEVGLLFDTQNDEMIAKLTENNRKNRKNFKKKKKTFRERMKRFHSVDSTGLAGESSVEMLNGKSLSSAINLCVMKSEVN